MMLRGDRSAGERWALLAGRYAPCGRHGSFRGVATNPQSLKSPGAERWHTPTASAIGGPTQLYDQSAKAKLAKMICPRGG